MGLGTYGCRHGYASLAAADVVIATDCMQAEADLIPNPKAKPHPNLSPTLSRNPNPNPDHTRT